MRLLRLLCLAILILLLAPAALAATAYTAEIQVTETGLAGYVMLPVIVDCNNQELADNYYMDSDGLDTLVKYNAISLPHMVADDKLLFASLLPTSNTKTFIYSTANTPALSAFYIITGYDGYFTIPDNAALEPGADFTYTLTAYTDTTTGTNKRLIFKDQAVNLSVTADHEITGRVYTSAPASETSYTAGADSSGTVNGTIAEAQLFTVGGADITLESVELQLVGNATPSGTITVSIRTVAGGLPTGSDLVSFTCNASDISNAGWAWYEFSFFNKITLTTATQYAIVLKASALGAVTYWRSDATAPAYAGGTRCSSDNNGATWTSAETVDYMFTVYKPGTTVEVSYNDVTNMASGEHDIILDINAGNLELTIDGTLRDNAAMGGGSIYDSAYDYYIGYNNCLPYIESFDIDISGAPVAGYAPVDIISGTTLPDEVGTYDGTITWGSNPAGVSVVLESLLPVAAAEAAGYTSSTPSGPISDAPDTPDMSQPGIATTLPGADVINEMMDAGDIPKDLFWLFLAFGLMMAIGYGVYALTHSLLAAEIAIIIVGVFFMLNNVVTWPAIPLNILFAARNVVIKERYGL